MRVLIADDHLLFRNLLVRSLNSSGVVEVDTAGDGAAARELILASVDARRPYDLVFLDWDMPHATGIQLIELMRDVRLYDGTPIWMLTAVREPAKAMEALRKGATGYITKPISMGELHERVNVALGMVREGYRYAPGGL